MKHYTILMAMLAATFIFFTGCTTAPVSSEPIGTPSTENPSPGSSEPLPSEPPSSSCLNAPLAWENTTAPHPERKPWSEHLCKEIDKRFASFAKAKDITNFCPKFNSLDKAGQLHALSEMVVAIVYYESGYNPTSWMTESTMGTDPITGVQVKSEGLLQLSYQDKQWAKWCMFDWAKDKTLPVSSPKKTIMDPYINLSCGIPIMANQIDKKGTIAVEKGYWAVTNNGKYSKVSKIQERVRLYAPECK